MTLNQFVKKWNRKYLDWDGKNGYQCVDVIKAYFVEVLGIPAKSYGNAKDYWNNHPKELKQVQSNPQKGDVVIWNIGKYGHIGVVLDKNNNGIIVFEQNDPLRSYCHIKVYTYSSIEGYLRPIINNILDMDYKELLQKLIPDLKKEFVEKDARFNFDNGATEICNNFKKYKYGTSPDDDKILANKFCKENISEAEKNFKRTKSRADVL